MAKTSTESPTAAAPQMYEVIKGVIGNRSDSSAPFRTGTRVTADQLFPGLDPDYIESEGLPRLLRLEVIKPVDGPAPTPAPAATPTPFALNQSRS